MNTTVRHRQSSLGRALWLLLFAAALVTVALNAGELRRIAEAVASSRWEYLLAAAAVQALFSLNWALFYATTFRAAGLHASFGRFFLLASAAHLVNLVSKSGGLGGLAIFLSDDAYGGTAARVSGPYLMVQALGFLAYFCVLVMALVWLYVRGALEPAEVAASAIVAVLAIVVGAAIVAALRSRAALERLLLAASTLTNRLMAIVRRRPAVRDEAALRFAAEVHETAEHLRHNPARYARPAAHALAVELLSAAVLYLVARSQGADIGFELALAGYAIALLFSIVAITPSGLGFVEVSLSVLLVSFGVPRPNAIATALEYRLFEFWVPLLLGLGCLRLLHYGRRERERA